MFRAYRLLGYPGRYFAQHQQYSHSQTVVHKQIMPKPLQEIPSEITRTFDDLNLHPSVVSALSATNKVRPTSIQSLAIPAVLSSQPTLIAAETGSGKTLAYLAPLLSAFKTQEGAPHDREVVLREASTFGLITKSRMRPSVLVLQPTRELVDQTYRVAKELSHVAKVRVRAALGGSRRRAHDQRLGISPVDVLIATPGAVQRLQDANKLYLSRVRAVVLDEADELLEAQHGFVDDDEKDASKKGRHFAEQLEPILSAVARGNVQHVYVAATVPARLERWTRERHLQEGLRIVKGEHLHKAASCTAVKTTFVRVDGSEGLDDAKFQKAVETVTMAVKRPDTGKILIFCDGDERRASLVQRLAVKGVHTVHLGGTGTNAWKRDEDWEAFRENRVSVAVCARSFARGIDDTNIRTVVMMDVPLTGGEYLHRVGRIRKSGRIYVFVSPRDVAVAEALFLGHVKGERVAGVDAKRAWSDFTMAGRDRIEFEHRVRVARKERKARWVDERESKIGTFRGKVGRNLRQPSLSEENLSGLRSHARQKFSKKARSR